MWLVLWKYCLHFHWPMVLMANGQKPREQRRERLYQLPAITAQTGQSLTEWTGEEIRRESLQVLLLTRVASRSQPVSQSGRRDSNPQHSAWKADTLPIELRPQSGAHCSIGARGATTGGTCQRQVLDVACSPNGSTKAGPFAMNNPWYWSQVVTITVRY